MHRSSDGIPSSKRHGLLTGILLWFCVLSGVSRALGQTESGTDPVVITSLNQKTGVRVTEHGQLQVNVSPKDAQTFKKRGWVRYSDFGALGDGKTDDMNAIAGAHAFANQQGLPVKADQDVTYYIGGKERTAVIRTNTDFGTAAFIIDDTDVLNRNASVFLVSSSLQPFAVTGIASLKRNQKKIDAALPGPCLVTVTNANVKRYIRFGLNQNNGTAQTDIFMVDKTGKVDMNAPIIWDFDQITSISALPIDEKPLTITGGRFTTIANQAESKYTYYSRNIAIKRSNVVVDGLEHRITGEGDHGAPYGGFLYIGDCSYVTIKNTILTGHKTYSTIGAAEKPVSMGSYDISANRALNVSFINCSQTNDINDRTYWGILGSNYCKNMLYDGCVFSRFDAHMGVANATIRNSTLGHMGINAIGSGTLTVENSTIRGNNLINLRSDYGSTWQGEFVIRNCLFVPAGGRPTTASLIGGSYSGQHDFGYVAYMPERIIIENLRIDDSNRPENYQGPAIFANFNPQMTDESYQEKFPYVITKEVLLRNVTTTSGKALRISDNPFLFKKVTVKVQ
ncbi:right-handed parallel beta-helix repeat-containing protein [Spirosoma knui]